MRQKSLCGSTYSDGFGLKLTNQIFGKFHTVWSEGFLYNVAPPELKNSPNIYFVIHNSVVLSKILKIVVIIGEIFSSGRATLYKNPSDQTVSIE